MKKFTSMGIVIDIRQQALRWPTRQRARANAGLSGCAPTSALRGVPQQAQSRSKSSSLSLYFMTVRLILEVSTHVT